MRSSPINRAVGAIPLLFLLLCHSSCHAQRQQRQSSADFYEGLKKQAKTEAAACFEKALDNPNMHIAAAAAAELMSLHYSGADVKAQTISRIRKNAPALIAGKTSGSWAAALDALGSGNPGDPGPDREKILALALNNPNRSPDEAIQYMLMKLRADNVIGAAVSDDANPANNGMFSNAENAAIAGRIAVSHSRYREALIFFRMVTEDAPDLFFQYPELLGDLGRTFQYTASERDGIDLFLEWEKNENLSAFIRFRLLFFAARIARQRGLPETVELFERALSRALLLPPETGGGGATYGSEQTDACIWYILNASLAKDPGAAIRYLEKYIAYWNDDGYYSDVMDKLARELLIKRRWADLINIAALVRNRPGVIGAKFAWITGRAVQAGLLSQRDAGYAVKALGDPLPDAARAYIQIAYNNASKEPSLAFDGKALYYRSLAAAALGAEFLPQPPKEPETAPPMAAAAPTVAAPPTVAMAAGSPGDSEAMKFLLGFFGNGAAKFAPRYVRMLESDLSVEESRRLAESFGKAGLYQESMRLVSLYARKDSYKYDKRDLELLYPRPFSEQVSQYARETGIGPAKLYGLIRAESAFNPGAISRSGAVGLTQLMPATAEEMAARILRRGGPDYTRRSDRENADEISGDTESADGLTEGEAAADVIGLDLLDPGANIHMGAVYLSYLETRLGDPLLAILAYNGGMNRVRRWRNSMPAKFPPDLFLEAVEYAETMEYGRAVMGAAAVYKALYQED